jgi:hypothetical protein
LEKIEELLCLVRILCNFNMASLNIKPLRSPINWAEEESDDDDKDTMVNNSCSFVSARHSKTKMSPALHAVIDAVVGNKRLTGF